MRELVNKLLGSYDFRVVSTPHAEKHSRDEHFRSFNYGSDSVNLYEADPPQEIWDIFRVNPVEQDTVIEVDSGGVSTYLEAETETVDEFLEDVKYGTLPGKIE
ncbi:hypothetical protein [Candidatus Nanohalococcus occultus]|uniref:hypothetical protein n=1 Tax=Candidatus Nanohalococcus occultus TaxID=2978047 RepID=UPI0039DFA360